MYWPTSFCERENSSKRWRISSESVSAVVPVRVTATVFAGAREVPSGPDLPGGPALGPEVVQEDRVLVGVHAVPEAAVLEGAELAVGRETLERVALQHVVRADVVERAGLKAEEAAVDPALVAGLLREAAHVAVAVQLGHAELELGLDDGHGRERPVAVVIGEQGGEVDIGHAVGVGRAEALAVEAVRHAGDPSPGRGVLAGLDALDLEAGRQPVVLDERLDELRPMSRAEHEAAEALLSVDADDVPQDRPPADLDERLRDRLGVLPQPRAATTAEDDDTRSAHGPGLWPAASRPARI